VAVPPDQTNEAIVEALTLWNQGSQQAAIDRVRPIADSGDTAMSVLLAWFLHQIPDRWKEAMPYVRSALQRGVPWGFSYVFGQMFNDAEFRHELPELFSLALRAGWQADPIAHAMAPFQQGDHAVAASMVHLAGEPFPFPGNWNELVAAARAEYEALKTAQGEVGARAESALSAIGSHETEIAESASTVKTRTQQLLTLIDQTTNAEVQSFFDSEATKNEAEASRLWKWGVGVLASAAFLAILPILIYYVGKAFGDNPFAKSNLVAAHFAPAVALGAVAGVLLARSRGRDRARQRARDLSVALGTMFVYSGQIVDESERQRFLHDMGRTVIESFLRQESTSGDSESTSLLSSVVSRA
jgi:mannose/fructose/N-acetylgalactosamine-specific phosphotransferase system component IIC